MLDVAAHRTYPVPVEAVWAAWTVSELIRRWWVDPMARLAYVMRFADPTGTAISPADAGIPPGVPDAVPHVVTFAPRADGTELSITESGYTTAPARDMSQAGLDQCLD